MQLKKGNKLQLIVAEVKTNTDAEMFSKQDPYVKVNYQLGGKEQTFQTSLMDNAGKHAIWGDAPTKNNSTDIVVEDFCSSITLSVMDKEVLSDNQLGIAWTDFATLCFNGGGTEWFKLYKGNETIGQIKIISKYCSEEKKEVASIVHDLPVPV